MFPLIVPGLGSTGTVVILNVLAVETQVPACAVTLIDPLVLPMVTVMLLVVDDPVQPEGNVQLYEVAPLTAAMV